MGASCTSGTSCSNQLQDEHADQRRAWVRRAADDGEESPFRVGQRILYVARTTSPELGTVRYVGSEDGGILGIELDFAGGSGDCDGHDSKSGLQRFQCEFKKGIYVKESSLNVHMISAASARSVLAVGKVSLALEVLREQETLQHMHVGAQAFCALVTRSHKSELSWATAFRKIWHELDSHYIFVMRSEPAWAPLYAAPDSALVLPAEGGPDELDSRSKESPIGVTPSDMELERALVSVFNVSAGKISEADAGALFEHCHQQWRGNLPCSVLLMLVRGARDLFSQEPTLRRLQTATHRQLVLVGDLGGQFKDLVHIWRRDSCPNEQTCYVFNGNICGVGDAKPRGGQDALKIWACILAFKLALPNCVHVNKGSHEDYAYSIHREDGLDSEIFSKYEVRDAYCLSMAFKDLFEVLPLASVIDDQVLVVHGGLPRNSCGPGAVTLAEVAHLRRPLEALHHSKARASQMVADITWSDPRDASGIGANRHGSGLVNFGPDVASRFMAQEGISLLVRSHQLPGGKFEGRGCEWWHDRDSVLQDASPSGPSHRQDEGQCLTIFSASDFRGQYSANSAAVLIFEDSCDGFSISEHSGAEAEATLKGEQAQYATQNELHALARAKATATLITTMARFRHKLLEAFTSRDGPSSGWLSLIDFRNCCSRVIPEIDWEDAISDNLHIFPVVSGRVNYRNFSSRYRLSLGRRNCQEKLEQQISRRLCEWLLIADHGLRESLQQPDMDDTVLSVDEFLHALARSGCLLSGEQVDLMFRCRTASTSHGVKLDSLLSSLAVDLARNRRAPVPAGLEAVPAQLDTIVRDILASMSGGVHAAVSESVSALLRRFFERADQDGSGLLDKAKLAAALKPLAGAAHLSDQDLAKLLRYLDSDKEGRVSYFDLFSKVEVRLKDEATTTSQNPGRNVLWSMADDLVDVICHVVMFVYGPSTIRCLLQQVTPPGSTRCRPRLFKQVLTALSIGPCEVHLTSQQIDCLIASLDVGVDGEFDFEDFLTSLEVVDLDI